MKKLLFVLTFILCFMYAFNAYAGIYGESSVSVTTTETDASVTISFDSTFNASSINTIETDIRISGGTRSAITWNFNPVTAKFDITGLSPNSSYSVSLGTASQTFTTRALPALQSITGMAPVGNSVAPGSTISFVYPASVQTVAPSHVSVKKDNVVQTGISVVVDSANRVCTVSGITLMPGSLYSVIVSVPDQYGRLVQENWAFTVKPNMLNPNVTLTGRSSNIDPKTDILTLTFDKEINTNTVNQYNIFIANSNSVTPLVYPTVILGNDRRTVSVSYTSNTTLAYNSTYVVVVTTGVKDIDGLGLATARSLPFTTSVLNRPYLVSTSPANNATKIPVNSKININFSAAMRATSFPTNTITSTTSPIYLLKTTNSANIPCTVSWNSNNTTVTLTPNTSLDLNTEYTLYISTENYGENNSNLATSTTVKFKTASGVVSSFIKDLSPDEAEINVPVGTKMIFYFTESMLASTITNENIYIKKESNGQLIDSVVEYDNYTKKVTITPLLYLEPDTYYGIYVTTGVKDANSYSIPSCNWSFKTAAAAAFAIFSKTPESNATNIAVNTKVVVVLNNELYSSSSVSSNNFYITEYSRTNKIPVNLSLNTARTEITLTPISALAYNKEYFVHLEGIRNRNGVTITPTSWSFKTADKPLITEDPLRYGTSNNPVVKINGKYIDFDVSPVIRNQRTMVPFRKIFEVLGATVTYDNYTDPKNPKILAYYDSKILTLYPNNPIAWINGRATTLDAAAFILNDRLLVPLRFVGEGLDMNVDYDPNTFNVIITSK